MPFLSLHEEVESPILKVGRSEALLVSMGLHLLLVLLFLFGPLVAARVLPQTVIAFLAPRQPAVRADLAASAPATGTPKPPDVSKIPLKFAYVSVPNDVAAPKNPKAPLMSDKNRRARQEVPTPKDARQFSVDPHSAGQSIDRVKPDPSRPVGREDVEAQNRPPRGSASGGAGRTVSGAGANTRNREPGMASTPEPVGDRRAGEGAGTPRAGTGEEMSGESPGERGAPDGTGDPGADPRENLKHALSDLKSGEYKFQFNNPAYLRGGGYGTMSIDSQDFPWGDYARRIYLVIRNNWYARIPLAAREGIRGWVCQRFVIEKDGTISSVEAVRPSGIAPFDKSSADALAASTPLPPLPQDFPEPREGVTFCFYYNMIPGEDGE
jgi:TonB family protein